MIQLAVWRLNLKLQLTINYRRSVPVEQYLHWQGREPTRPQRETPPKRNEARTPRALRSPLDMLPTTTFMLRVWVGTAGTELFRPPWGLSPTTPRNTILVYYFDTDFELILFIFNNL